VNAPRLIAALLLLITQAPVFASAAAQTKTNPGPPAALVVAILCYALRKQPIGGWLLYYCISLYAALAVSLLLFATTLQNYSPARWQSTELYALAITTTALGQLPLLAHDTKKKDVCHWLATFEAKELASAGQRHEKSLRFWRFKRSRMPL
jgi:hypothetical protein